MTPTNDIATTLEHLRSRLDLVDRALIILIALNGPSPVGEPARRGRKSMGAAERIQVSDRMKLYWKNLRDAKSGMIQ
jgi:hypothetical protein